MSSVILEGFETIMPLISMPLFQVCNLHGSFYASVVALWFGDGMLLSFLCNTALNNVVFMPNFGLNFHYLQCISLCPQLKHVLTSYDCTFSVSKAGKHVFRCSGINVLSIHTPGFVYTFRACPYWVRRQCLIACGSCTMHLKQCYRHWCLPLGSG